LPFPETRLDKCNLVFDASVNHPGFPQANSWRGTMIPARGTPVPQDNCPDLESRGKMISTERRRPQSRPNHDCIVRSSTRRRRWLPLHTSPHGGQPQPLIQGGAIFRKVRNGSLVRMPVCSATA
jgi:hypothetical protein